MHRLKVEQGAAVICYTNAEKVVGMGKLAEPLEKLIYSKENEWKYNNKVFLVYGHDTKAECEIENMIRKWGLTPLAIDNLPTEGRTIIEQLEKYIPKANYGIVLATPDDLGRSKESKDEKYRARQNVILEMGMLFAKFGRKRVAVIIKQSNFEKPSDIEGILYFPYKDSIEELEKKLSVELKKCGY